MNEDIYKLLGTSVRKNSIDNKTKVSIVNSKTEKRMIEAELKK